tara:strand:+ start:1839 stop:2849 length:1011 start_codon:yes stop_codon:yes gene_type:complete
MQNKLPIGQTAEAAHVGGGGTGATAGNDQSNKEALEDITLERKRPRYSIFAMAVNGPNFYKPAGVWDLISGGSASRSQTTTKEAPYDFSDMLQTSDAPEPNVPFQVKVDGAAKDDVPFRASDFDNPEKATADEVVTRINAVLDDATASVVDGNKVKIESDDAAGAIEIVDLASNSILGFPLGLGITEPNRTSPGADPSSFANGAGYSLEFEYEAREPVIFIGGQLFIGEITTKFSATTLKIDALSGATTIHVEKVEANSPFAVASIDTHTHRHGPMQLGPDLDNKNVLLDIPGSRSQFSKGERFRFRVVPDGAGYNTTTHGLRGVSAVLWFKALHR